MGREIIFLGYYGLFSFLLESILVLNFEDTALFSSYATWQRLWCDCCLYDIEYVIYLLQAFLFPCIKWGWLFLVPSRWGSGKESACQCKRCMKHRFDPWVGKIPCRRKWQPTRVLLPGESCGQRSLMGNSPWGHKELDMTE